MIVFTRFRVLPDEQMKHVDAYLRTGKPIIGIRPSVVAFRNKPDSNYAKYSSNYRVTTFVAGLGVKCWGPPGSHITAITGARAREVFPSRR